MNSVENIIKVVIIMEEMNSVVEVAAKKGLLTKENGILVLAAIGATTIGYTVGKYLRKKMKA